MKIDLHVHSRLSKNFEFNHDSIDKLKELGSRRGLDGFALTEHIHARNFWGMHDYMLTRHPYQDGYYDMGDGFRIFSGCEVTVGERVDFIVVGELPTLEQLDASFYPRLSDDHHPAGLEFLARARELGLTVTSAHPFRPGKETAKLPLDQVFGLVDAIEVNGRDYGTEHRVAELSRAYNKPVSGGSDAHYYLQVGIRSTVIPGTKLTLGNLRRAFAEQASTAHCKPYAEQLVKLCKEIKNVAKLRKERQLEEPIVAA